MNSTNRALNRLVIIVTGLLLLASGTGALVLATIPVVRADWESATTGLAERAQPWVADPVVGTASLLVLGSAAVSAVLVVLLLAFVMKQGRGRSATALRLRDRGSSTRIDLAVPRALLEEHLADRGELAALRISAYEVRGTPMLKITARCRRGVSPAFVAREIGAAVDDLERIIGTDVPAFVQLTGGFHAGSATRPQVA